MRHLILLLVLLAGLPLHAEFRPALMIESVAIKDPTAYAALLDRANALMRERHQVPVFLRVYLRPTITGQSREGFALSPSPTLGGVMTNRQSFATDPQLAAIREQLDALTTRGPASYLKAVRFDGTNAPGWLCNRFVQTDDEARLLDRVGALATLLRAADGAAAAPHINVFRVIAGSDTSTHLVSINAASAVQLAAFLDYLVTQPNPLADPKITVRSTTLYQEL